MNLKHLTGLLLISACVADSTGPTAYPPMGAIRLTVATVPGGTADVGGIWVTIGGNHLLVPSRGIDLVLSSVPVGRYASSIDSLSPWCAATPTSATVEVTASDTAALSYHVTCDTLHSTVRVITTTTAVDAPDPDGYQVTLGGTSQVLLAQDTAYFHLPAWGEGHATIADIASWCSSPTPAQTVAFDPYDTLSLTFSVQCLTAIRQVDLVLDVLGVPDSAILGLRVDSATHVRLVAGIPQRVTVRADRRGVAVDSTTRGCLALIPDNYALLTGAAGAVVVNRLRVGCGRLAGLTERSTYSPMALLQTGLDGRDTVILAEGLQHPFDGALSRNGEWIVGEQYRFEINPTRFEWRAYRERIDGSDFQLLHDWTTDRVIWPRWGPDDDHISYIEKWSPGPQQVVVRARDGSTTDTLLLPPRHFVHAEWSPAGDRIALAAWCQFPDPTCPTGIVIASPGSTTPIATYPVNFTSGQMAWSPDGLRIAFIGPESRVHVLRLANGVITKVAHSTSSYQDESPEWDPSGELIGFIRIVPDQNQQPFHWAFVTAADGGPELVITQQRIYAGPYWQR